MTSIYLSNLQPDPIDNRDYLLQWDQTAILPKSVDLRPYTGQVEDQLNIGSCTANAMAKNAEMFLIANGKLDGKNEDKDPNDMSRLFNYYTSRSFIVKQGQPYTDSGSCARFALRAAKNFGIASEQVWPYDPAQVETQPSQSAYDNAQNFKAGDYYRIDTTLSSTYTTTHRQAIKWCLASGYPVQVAMRVGRSLTTLQPNQVYSFVNTANGDIYIGNHEMLIVGYDDDKGTWIVENSWGKDWGTNGYFEMVQGVIDVDMFDLWVLKSFAGFTKIGPDLTKPAPQPDPVPPPQPAPTPAPQPTPSPVSQNKDYTPYVIVGFLVAAAITKLLGVW